MNPRKNPILLHYLDALDVDKNEVALTIEGSKTASPKKLKIHYSDTSSTVFEVPITHNEFMEAWVQFTRIWRGFRDIDELEDLN